MSRLEEYEKSRKENFNYLLENNIEPFPYKYNRTHITSEIQEKYKDLSPNEYSKEDVNVAGRVFTIRNLGKIAFLDLNDQHGKIQIVVKAKDNDNMFSLIKKLDQGDIIGATGKIFKTKTNEVSIDAKDITFLAKCFLPLPEKYHGLQDQEIKYRKKHLDLMINSEVREIYIKRAKIIDVIRKLLKEKGFLEVETPLLQPLYGGANARPFITESFVWKRPFYLAISPELYLKRLLVGGFEKVFTICKNFRNEGIDKSHNPEFTMLECYEVYKDYNDAMNLIEEIHEKVALELYGTTKITYQGNEYDFKRPWKKTTMIDAIKEFAKIDVASLNEDQLINIIKENNIELPSPQTKGLLINSIFEHFCEDHLYGPIHVTDHPKELTPLCKIHRNNKELIERDEPYVNKWEIGNIYSELNDPYFQEEQMISQKDNAKEKGENHPIDEEFIEALKYGMPPAYGIGFGVDRLVMIFTDSPTIRDVILFPMMRDNKQEKQ
jgi:lysyl-tRNA synthetase, class II